MLNVLKLILSLFFINLPFVISYAQTVSTDLYFKSKIQQSREMPFEQIESYFKKYQSFEYICVYDTELNNTNSWDDILTFKNYIDSQPNGDLLVNLHPQDYGFDLQFLKIGTQAEYLEIEEVKGSLSCDAKNKNGSCLSLRIKSKKDFQFSTFNMTDTNYSDEAQRFESWILYFFKNEIYAERQVDFQVQELDIFGRRRSTITFSKAEVCHLKPRHDI